MSKERKLKRFDEVFKVSDPSEGGIVSDYRSGGFEYPLCAVQWYRYGHITIESEKDLVRTGRNTSATFKEGRIYG